MYQQFTFTFPDDIDLNEESDLVICNGFILTLPFRLRTGAFFSLHVGNSFDVIFRNRIDIPFGTPTENIENLIWEGKTFRPREHFFTEGLILDKNLPASPQFLDEVLAFMNRTSFITPTILNIVGRQFAYHCG